MNENTVFEREIESKYEVGFKAVDAVSKQNNLPYLSNIATNPTINGGQSVPNLSFFSWKRDIEKSLQIGGKSCLCEQIGLNFLNIFLGFYLPITYEYFNKINAGIIILLVIAILVIFFRRQNKDDKSAILLDSILADMKKFKEPEEEV